jgi:hypothetical protein
MAERPNKRRRRPSPSHARLPPVESTINQPQDSMDISPSRLDRHPTQIIPSLSSSPNSQDSRESDIIKENHVEPPNIDEQAMRVTRRSRRLPRRIHSINNSNSNNNSKSSGKSATQRTTTTRTTRVLRHLGNSPR